MGKFIYRDYNGFPYKYKCDGCSLDVDYPKGHILVGELALQKVPIIFECEAESITGADKLFEAAKGMHPIKMPFVGCSVK